MFSLSTLLPLLSIGPPHILFSLFVYLSCRHACCHLQLKHQQSLQLDDLCFHYLSLIVNIGDNKDYLPRNDKLVDMNKNNMGFKCWLSLIRSRLVDVLQGSIFMTQATIKTLISFYLLKLLLQSCTLLGIMSWDCTCVQTVDYQRILKFLRSSLWRSTMSL